MPNQTATKYRIERLKRRINEECTRIPANTGFINSLNLQLRELEAAAGFEKLFVIPCPFGNTTEHFHPQIHKTIGNPNSTDGGVPF